MLLKQRLIALDVFRGLTIILMIIVNSPGNNTPYPLLMHATWNGCTLADLVFPWFIFIVGISAVMHLSAEKNRGVMPAVLWSGILKRTGMLFSLGLLLNAFPHHFNLDTLRILGVLQRLALCYLVSAGLFLTTSTRTQWMIICAILLNYWFILSFFGSHIVTDVDELILGSQHLYKAHIDPEGLLSTLPCFATVLLGNLTAVRMLTADSAQHKARDLLFAGLLSLMTGWLWSLVLPFNKSLTTPSTVLWTTGLGLVLFTGLYYLIEIKQRTGWVKPFMTFGQNALLIYLLHILGLKIQALILLANADGEVINLRQSITEHLFFWMPAPSAALLYGLCYTLFWYALLKLKTLSTRLLPMSFKAARNSLR